VVPSQTRWRPAARRFRLRDQGCCGLFGGWGRWLQHTPISHTHYWDDRTAPGLGATDKRWAIDVLRESLDLDRKDLLAKLEVDMMAHVTVRELEAAVQG
jgi:hypothetical protein